MPVTALEPAPQSPTIKERAPQGRYNSELCDRVSEEWDLDSARLILGLDLIVVYAVNQVEAIVRPVNSSWSEYLGEEELRQINEVARAFDDFSYEEWMEILDGLGDLPDPEYPTFRRDDPLPALSVRLDSRSTPYAGLVGCRPGPDDFPEVQYIYAVAWVDEGHEALYPLTQAAQEVVKVLSFASLTTSENEHRARVRFIRSSSSVLGQQGQESIPLRRSLPRLYDSTTQTSYLGGFAPVFSGRGYTPELAALALDQEIAANFQQLYRTRPVNRDEQQERVWRLLCRFIDVQAYRGSKPMRLFRTGTITGAPSTDERVVVWEEDSREDRIRLSQAPEIFASWSISQRFEAEVYYNRRTKAVDHIEKIEPIGPANTPEQAWAFWDSIPRVAHAAEESPDRSSGETP